MQDAISKPWFQSRLSHENAKCTVLEGDDFANKIVANATSPEHASRMVRAVNAFDAMHAALKSVQATLKPTDPLYYAVADALAKAEAEPR